LGGSVPLLKRRKEKQRGYGFFSGGWEKEILKRKKLSKGKRNTNVWDRLNLGGGGHKE